MKKTKPHEYLIEANTGNQQKLLEWQQHREKIQEKIQLMMDEGMELGQVLIVGGGNCNDLPLEFFARNFNQVILTDIDINSIYFAKNRLPDNLQNKVICYHWDITDLHQTMIREIDERIKKGGTHLSILTDVITKIEGYMNNPHEILMPDWLSGWHSYDCVISTCVTSQLFAAIFGYYITEYFGNPLWGRRRRKLLRLKQVARHFSDHYLTRQHIQLLYQLVKRNGYVLLASDVLEYRCNNKLGQQLTDVRDLLNPDLQQYYLKNGYKVTGAIASTVIEAYIQEKLSIIHQDAWIWPFGSGKYYLVQGFVLKPPNHNSILHK